MDAMKPEIVAHPFDALPMPGYDPRPALVAPPVRSDPPLTTRSVAADAWDACIADFGEVCQEQTYAFARSRWPSVLLEPVLFVAGDRTVGGALVMVAPLPLRLGAVALINRGPMLRDARSADRAVRHREMVDLLISEYAERRRMMLSVQLRAPTAPEDVAAGDLARRGFAAGHELAYPDRYLVNLEPQRDQLRRSLTQKWRYHLAKSEKEGLVFEAGNADGMMRFGALYEAMTQRKRFPDYSAYDVLPQQVASREDALRPRFFFVRRGAETVAGAVIFTAGDAAVYLYGATDDRALAHRAGYFLHWHIVDWLKQNTRARWYDLGGCDGFNGLHQFKKGLVGSAGVIAPMPPWMNFADGRLPMLLGRSAFAVRDMLTSARRLLRPRDDQAKPDMPPHKGAH